MSDQHDSIFMQRAIALARRGWYTTQPNPRVGCVLVRDQQVLAEGWHRKAGGPHAEVAALTQLASAQGATAYVTLEPCSHFGKTPPCADALIKAGVSRVVVAMSDPNPLVAGQGIAKLRAAGITVDVGLMQSEAEALNQGFNKRMRMGLPYVRSKLAMTLDGRTALADGSSQWITCTESRWDVQRLRAESAVIMTGVQTVLADDPALTIRDLAANPHFKEDPELCSQLAQPVRVILDSQLQTPVHSKMARLPGRSMILTGISDARKTAALQQAGFEVFCLPLVQQRLDLLAVLQFLAQQQFNDVLVEAGPTLNGALLAQNLVDELMVYMAPSLLGDTGRGLFTLPEIQTMADKKVLAWRDVRRVGTDLRLTLALQREH